MTCACVIACDTYSVELISLFTIVIDKKYSDFSLCVKFGERLQNNFLFELAYMLIKWYRIVQLHNNDVIMYTKYISRTTRSSHVTTKAKLNPYKKEKVD